MPSADEDLKRRMVARFGDVGTHGPIDYLEERGYRLRRDSFWTPKEGVQNIGQMERDEFECLMYLMHEWDFGGLTTEGNTNV